MLQTWACLHHHITHFFILCLVCWQIDRVQPIHLAVSPTKGSSFVSMSLNMFYQIVIVSCVQVFLYTFISQNFSKRYTSTGDQGHPFPAVFFSGTDQLAITLDLSVPETNWTAPPSQSRPCTVQNMPSVIKVLIRPYTLYINTGRHCIFLIMYGKS